MKVIFMGTPEFAVPVLKALIESEEHEVTAVVTQPDKARGRSGKLVFTPVKEAAVEAGIPVYTPRRVKAPEFVEQLKAIPCDVIVVVAFGQLLSKEILDYPPYGCINVHASLLPRWRGAAPIQWAILAGDKKSGLTTMQLDEGLDTGDMLLKKEVDIAPDETGGSLHDRLAELGGKLLLDTLKGVREGAVSPVKQNEEESTYASMLTKEMGKINWEEAAEKIERYVRGLNSWPSAYTGFRSKTLKVWKSEVVGESCLPEAEEESAKGENTAPGTIVRVEKNSFLVKTGNGYLRLLEVQLEGKKRMDAGSFLRGVSVEKGEILCI